MIPVCRIPASRQVSFGWQNGDAYRRGRTDGSPYHSIDHRSQGEAALVLISVQGPGAATRECCQSPSSREFIGSSMVRSHRLIWPHWAPGGEGFSGMPLCGPGRQRGRPICPSRYTLNAAICQMGYVLTARRLHLHSRVRLHTRQTEMLHPVAPNRPSAPLSQWAIPSRRSRWAFLSRPWGVAVAKQRLSRHGCSVAPEVLEPGRRQLRVANGVLDVLVAQVGLERSAYHGPRWPRRTRRRAEACADAP